MKIVSIVGARPQFIKTAMVARALALRDNCTHELIHTGQHFDDNMSRVFFEELEIPEPAHHLGICGLSHGVMTGRMMEQLEPLLHAGKPDWTLVYGDTNSTLAGALVAAKLHLPVAHVEAGLRSFNRRMPEEVNRVLVDHAADLLFTPTQIADDNLAHEGVSANRIVRVGDVMHAAAMFYGAMTDEKSDILSRLNLVSNGFALATIHREENTENCDKLNLMIAALESVAEELPVVWPVHPRLRGQVESKSLRLIEPVGYLDMQCLVKNAAVVLTDSGGLQKEAFFHRVPCVTLREETEWKELVNAGWNRLAGTGDKQRILDCFREARNGVENLQFGDWYGAGDTADQISEALMK